MSGSTGALKKRCRKCNILQDIKCFPKAKHRRRLANGTIKIYEYHASQCYSCNAARIAAWKDKLRAKGELEAAVKRWQKNRNVKALRRYNREWYRLSRGENLHHVWKKYADEAGSRVGMIYLDPQQLVAYFDQFKITDDEGVKINGVRLSETENNQMGRWRRGAVKRIELQIADRWAAKFDLPLWEIEEAAKIAV